MQWRQLGWALSLIALQILRLGLRLSPFEFIRRKQTDGVVRKGQGKPAYSAFEGETDDGTSLADVLRKHGIEAVDIVGIATDYCVHATARDALDMGLSITVRANLCVGVNPGRSLESLAKLVQRGATITLS